MTKQILAFLFCFLRDKISQHKKSSCHQKLMEEKNKLKRNLTDEELDVLATHQQHISNTLATQRNLTDEELDVFFRTNYTFQMYPNQKLMEEKNKMKGSMGLALL